MIETPDLLDALCAEVRPRILREFRPDSCLVSTATAIDVLAYFGVEAVPVECEAYAGNRLAREAMALGDEPDWAAGAWTVGIVSSYDDLPLRSNGWPGGHLVAVVDGYLVDLSADQIARPAKSILVSPLVVPLAPGEWSERGDVVSVRLDLGAGLSYLRTDPPERSYRSARDWSVRSRRRRIVGDSIRALRARLEG